jgi:acetyl-CoA carboxylase alpha subunit
MKLQDALQASRKSFFSRIKEIIDEMGRLNGDYNGAVSQEIILIMDKFKEQAVIEVEKFLD